MTQTKFDKSLIIQTCATYSFTLGNTMNSEDTVPLTYQTIQNSLSEFRSETDNNTWNFEGITNKSQISETERGKRTLPGCLAYLLITTSVPRCTPLFSAVTPDSPIPPASPPATFHSPQSFNIDLPQILS